MRKHLVWTLGLALALAATGIALAAGTTTQTISGKATPSKLPEGKRVGVSLKFSETTGTTDPSGVQPPTKEVRVLLDKDFAITTRGLPRCTFDELADKSTADARTACHDAQVGTGSAVARLSNGSGGHIDIPAVVTAFNDFEEVQTGAGPKRLIVLHIVVGESSAFDAPLEITRIAGAYGPALATIPGGASEPIHTLTLTLHRSYTVKGERENYISARCSHGKLLYKGRFTYDGSPPLTATDSQSCTVRS